ncbi:MAG TPA: xanthine dehydrogenase family protein subunit M [Armatimonadota bacterium]|nr:xanthine dehydrogenase family protein subunit M [Armatimonadota bacterium]
MASFEYSAPRSIDGAITLLTQAGDEGRALAGGTDILTQLREGRRRASLLVDIKGIPELNQLCYDSSAGLTVGAALPCYRLCSDEQAQRRYPGLLDGAGIVGGVQIQGRASVGGNLCNASPAADSIPALIVLGAMCVIAGPEGERTIAVEHFCTGPGKNALQRGEILVALRLPPPEPNSGVRYLRFTPRNEMDIAVVGAGAAVTLEDDGRTIRSARVALGAVAPIPLLAATAGEVLAGAAISREVIERAAETARALAVPITDMRGSAAQRRHLAAVLTRRALEGAIERARKSM